MTRYRAKRGQSIPMPGAPGQFIPDSGDGIPVDEMSPFYARMIADGDLVVAEPDPEPAPASPTKGAK